LIPMGPDGRKARVMKELMISGKIEPGLRVARQMLSLWELIS
jgi:hypothetical protein